MKSKETGNRKRRTLLGIGLVCLFLLGCGKTGEGGLSLALEEGKSLSGDNGEEPGGAQDAGENLLAEKDTQATSPAGGEQEEQATSPADGEPEEPQTLWVHICGEVKSPGVYELAAGSRVYEALQAAGGATEKGEPDYLNLAAYLTDGMKITLPSAEEVKQWEEEGESGIEEAALGGGVSAQDGRINLNTADEAALCTLPGIGESRARSIILYREENGPFESIEEIMNVSGIKEAAFSKIKEYITVS